MSRTGSELIGAIAVYQEETYVIRNYDDDMFSTNQDKYLLVLEADIDAGEEVPTSVWVERSAFIIPADDVPPVESVSPPMYVESERVYVPDAQAYGIVKDNEKRDDDGVRLYTIKIGNDEVERREDAIVRDVLPKMSAAQKLAVIERYFMDVIEEAGQEEKVSHLSLMISASGNPHGSSAFELKFSATVNWKESAETDDLFRSYRIANLRRAENDANKPRLLPKL